MESRKKGIQLALSGGGARGLAHIGVIEALQKDGFQINGIAGTSMGALIGAAFAMNKMKTLKTWFLEMDRNEMLSLIDFTFSTQGLVKGDRIFEVMKDFIPDCNIEDLSIPFAAVATDLVNKREVVFRTGSIYYAIRASVAIPTIFTPIKTDDGLLVDGGLLNNLPLKYLKAEGNELTVASSVNSSPPKRVKNGLSEEVSEPVIETENESILPNSDSIKRFFDKINVFDQEESMNYFNLINQTIDLMLSYNVDINIARHKPDLLFEVSREVSGMFDFYRAEEIIEAGRLAAEKVLAEMNN
ncbi:MAG: patatin-like phospholipase family protein [Salibacteraceae bacterium]